MSSFNGNTASGGTDQAVQEVGFLPGFGIRASSASDETLRGSVGSNRMYQLARSSTRLSLASPFACSTFLESLC